MLNPDNIHSLSNASIGKAFKAILKNVGRDELGGLLFNWNESELNPDGDRIIAYPGRDGRYTRGKEGGKIYIRKRELLAWVLSEQPFDEKVYGAEIRNDSEWAELIQKVRNAAMSAQDCLA